MELVAGRVNLLRHEHKPARRFPVNGEISCQGNRLVSGCTIIMLTPAAPPAGKRDTFISGEMWLHIADPDSSIYLLNVFYCSINH